MNTQPEHSEHCSRLPPPKDTPPSQTTSQEDQTDLTASNLTDGALMQYKATRLRLAVDMLLNYLIDEADKTIEDKSNKDLP